MTKKENPKGRRPAGSRRDVRRRRTALGALALTAAVCLPSSGAVVPAGDETGVADTRAVLEKWVETRRLISREQHDWSVARQVLRDRIDLLEREIESLRGKLSDARESIGEADERRSELMAENERLKEGTSALDEVVLALETRTGELLRRLPDPIRERVEPLRQRFPEDPETTEASLGERFQNVVGVLNEVNRFHGEVNVTSEVRTLRAGATAEVTALYLGIGLGYYVTGKGDAAGIGTAGSEGWTWAPANEAAAEIARAIAILQNEVEADFVPLPVRFE